MEMFNCFSILYSKFSPSSQTIEQKKNQSALRDPYMRFTISSDFTKIELTEELIMKMKNDEDFEPKFHKEFMNFIWKYEDVIIYRLQNEHIWSLVNEIWERWMVAIKIHPLSSEYFEERRAICGVFSWKSQKFKDWFRAKFISIWNNRKLFEEPEKSAIHRSWVIWQIAFTDDCDKLEEKWKYRMNGFI